MNGRKCYFISIAANRISGRNLMIEKFIIRELLSSLAKRARSTSAGSPVVVTPSSMGGQTVYVTKQHQPQQQQSSKVSLGSTGKSTESNYANMGLYKVIYSLGY